MNAIIQGAIKQVVQLADFVNQKVLGMVLVMGVLTEIFQKFLFRDWQYLYFLIVVFCLDTVFGVWKAIKKREFDFDKIWDIIAKAVVYAGILIVGHVLSYFTIGEKVAGYGWVANAFYSLLILFEARSALRNMGDVYPKLAVIHWAESLISDVINSKQQLIKGKVK